MFLHPLDGEDIWMCCIVCMVGCSGGKLYILLPYKVTWSRRFALMHPWPWCMAACLLPIAFRMLRTPNRHSTGFWGAFSTFYHIFLIDCWFPTPQASEATTRWLQCYLALDALLSARKTCNSSCQLDASVFKFGQLEESKGIQLSLGVKIVGSLLPPCSMRPIMRANRTLATTFVHLTPCCVIP